MSGPPTEGWWFICILSATRSPISGCTSWWSLTQNHTTFRILQCFRACANTPCHARLNVGSTFDTDVSERFSVCNSTALRAYCVTWKPSAGVERQAKLWNFDVREGLLEGFALTETQTGSWGRRALGGVGSAPERCVSHLATHHSSADSNSRNESQVRAHKMTAHNEGARCKRGQHYSCMKTVPATELQDWLTTSPTK